ncbi:GHKL domain-containing protein [Lacibacter luteus]|uniref:GHKL domain-containing protein n=1 Tax=Lacibacter luteus TaxID=2508719 RepID=A0A4Q1CH46_9BACT|nr:histidine kinase [Lacibacter luteus]RXK59287.1 GHKL domain-containing protein [Lacibacter luteus]
MAVSPFRTKQFMIPFCVGWFVWIAMQQLALYQMGLNWFEALTDSLVTNTLLIYVSLLLFTILRFYVPRSSSLLNLFFWISILTAGWFFAGRFILGLFYNETSHYVVATKNTWPIRIAIGFLINGCICLVGYAYFNWQERTETEKQKTEAEQLSKEAELYKLRQQLQPHFLFNSLNSINALIGTRPAEARQMVQQLSDFLRSTLKKEEQQWVKLEDEMQTLQLYLAIEKVRFGHRLHTQLEMDADALQLQLPALLLQPLVENAIKFGLYDTTEESHIHLKATARAGQLLIAVENPYDPSTSAAQKGTGFGLSSVQRRLFLMFGRNDLLKTETNGTTFNTQLFIPQPSVSDL